MPPPGDYSGAYTQLDKLAFAGGESVEARGYAVTGEPWFAYTDAKAGYENGSPANGQAQSSITNESFKAKDENDGCKEIDSYRVVLQDGNDWAVQIKSYTLNQGTYKYDPFVALGLDARKNSKTASEGSYDLSKCTSGFSYQYKGSSHKFKVLNKKIGEGVGSDHYKLIGEAKSTSATWTNVVIPPAELAQPNWVTSASSTAFSLEDVRGWAWELPGDTKSGSSTTPGHSPMTGSLAIKNFRCLGDMSLPPAKGASACDTGGSSSSRGSSSSNTPLSSSRLSSSSAGNTPVVLPQIVFSNSLKAMQNSVNLQSTNDASLKIFDLKGNMVLSLKFAQGGYIVSLANLPRGVYIVKASNASWKQTITVPVK
jgi:hypothetical protein